MAVTKARTDTSTTQRRSKKMSDKQLVGFLARKIQQAMNDEGGDLSDTRSNLFKRYMGEPYGTERDGYSKFRTREVMEAVEWAKPALLRIFLGSDRAVAFEPQGPEDEDAAAQETDVVNYKVLRANGGDGFIAIYNFITDALINPTSYIKAWVEEETTSTSNRVVGVPAEGLQLLLDNEDFEILEQDSRTISIPMQVPHPQDPTQLITQITPVEVFDLRYRQTKTRNVLRIEAVPGEEALVDNNLTTINLDHGDFTGHRTRKSFSQLVREGFDPDELDAVGTEHGYTWNDERTTRLFYEDESPDSDDEDDPSMREFWVHELQTWVDFEGTGVAQFRKIILIGDHIFENEETEYQSMVAMSSVLVPHKHNGLSIAQLVEDLQELLTTLTRQLLDNVYRINTGKTLIDEDALLPDGTTLEAMLNIQAEWIPVASGTAQRATAPIPTNSMVADLLPVIQHVQASTPLRSGIAPENNLDSAVLQQSTMGAFMGAMEKAGERVEMIARIMAETGFKQLFRKVHQLCRMYPDIATAIKLRNEWINVDPSDWAERTDMSVNVGLGFNNKQQMVMLLVQLIEMQKEALAANTGLADLEKLYNSLAKLVEASGVGAIEQFFNDPTADDFEQPEQQPDAATILAQAQAQALGQEQQRKMMEVQQKGQAEMARVQQDGMKTNMDAQARGAEVRMRMQELELKTRELDIRERELDIREAEARAGIGNTNADTELKHAQQLKTYTETGRTAAEAQRVQAETSDEMREARSILESRAIEAPDDDDDEGGREDGES